MYSEITMKASLKRFVFPHPRFMENPLQTSIFASAVEQSLELAIDENLNLVSKEIPVVCEIVDEMNVYVGCESGAIVHVQLEPLHEAQSFVEVVIRESGALLSALRGLIPLGGKRQVPSVVGLAVFQNELVFALYDDAKLRVWSYRRNNSLIMSMDVPVEAWNPETPNTASKWSLKLLPHTEASNQAYEDQSEGNAKEGLEFKLGIYVGMSGDSQVQIYHGMVDEASGSLSLQMEGVSYYGNDKFVDFALASGQSASIDEDWLHPRVWGLWHGLQPDDGDYVLAHTQISRSALHSGGVAESSACLEVNNWTEAALENPSSGLDSLVTPLPSMHQSLAESFLSHLLQPGRFTTSMLSRALKIFTNAEISRSQPSSIRELKAIIAYELRREIQQRQTEQEPHSSHQTWRIAHSTWTQFLELCIQVWKEDHTPLALFCVPNTSGLVLIVKLGQITVLREASPLESLRLLSTRSRPLSHASLLSSFLSSHSASTISGETGLDITTSANDARPTIQSRQNSISINLVTETFKALDVMSLIKSQLGSAKLELFEQRLFNLTDPVASASCDVEYLFGSPMEPQMNQTDSLLSEDTTMTPDERMARRSFVNRLIRATRAIARVDVCVERLLALVESSINGPQFKSYHTTASSIYPELKIADGVASSQLLDSELFEDVLARGFSQSVSSGFELLRDTMYLGLLCIRAELQLNLRPNVLKNLHSLLPRISEQLKAYHVLKWFSIQHITGNPIEPDTELPMRRLGPKLAAGAPLLRQRLSTPITAISLYIMDIRSEIANEYDEHGWRAIRSFIPILVHLVHPRSVLGDKCSVVNQLLFRGQHLSLFEYVRLLNSKSAYHRDLLGDCYLALAQYEKAIECFVQASINIELETSDGMNQSNPMTSSASMMMNTNVFSNLQEMNPLVHSVRQALGRDRKEKESLGLYYWKALIPDLVAQNLHDLVIKAANCALSCTDPSDEATFSELYLYIFKAALAIEYHEQAYTAMIHITEDTRRMDALTEFVLFFIERGKSRELAELPFVNMLDQVHLIIMNRAKSSEMIQPHPNLYQVLYAFHIAKSNYRLAAECMFVYAERLSVEHHVGLPILERYSAAILAVLTALKLIDPQHGYLTTRRSTSSSATNSPSKRPREVDIASDIHSLAIDKPLPQGNKNMQAIRHVEVYDIPRLELMHLLAQCNLKLARKNRSLALTGLKSASSTLTLLLNQSEFALAYRLAHAAKLKMDDIFAEHALRCLALPPLTTTTEAQRWGELRTHLQTYDSASTNFHYHYVVADAILSSNSRISLPIWLIYTFKSGTIAPASISLTSQSEPQPSLSPQNQTPDKNIPLMALYLRHGLFEDAAKLASEMILRASHKLEAYTDPNASFQSILPYQHIEQVLVHLQETNSQLHSKVAKALVSYIDLATTKVNLKLDQPAE